ncbi:MAG TPA: MBL fold metallo-hydrolase [Myxococcaceae bacterium]|nr:MBL fold metallo-hydrolase [Myxococcaceae bacterium]
MKTWKRWALGIVGLVVAALVAVPAVLLRKGKELPPAPPHARAEPALSNLPRIKVCWVESGHALPMPSTASALLIRHPAGDVLVDAGDSSRFDEEVANHPFADRLWLKSFPRQLMPRGPFADKLRALGVDPSRLTVLLTHSHLDHAGGLMDLPKEVQVRIPQAEIDFLRARQGTLDRAYIPAHAERILAQARPIAFEPRPYETFDESADLFGDGSVVLVPLAGHTPGSMGIFVNVSPTRRLMHAGDTFNTMAELSPPRAKAFIMEATDFDPPRAHQVVSRLAQLHQTVPSLKLIPAHDRHAYEAVFGEPGRCLEAE